MSRSGYSDEGEGINLWRGAVRSALRGKRGQAALQALGEAMDAMPVKTLAAASLVNADGEFCTLGVLGQSRGMDMSQLDPDDWEAVAKAFGLSEAMVREIVYLNDERCTPYDYPGEKRWLFMRDWIAKQLVPSVQQRKGQEE